MHRLSGLDLDRLRQLQATLLARARIAPPAGWPAVFVGPYEVGVTSPEIAAFSAARLPHARTTQDRLWLNADGLDASSCSALLQELALRLRDAGLIWGWRDELLDVRPLAGGAVLASIERAACRALGFATWAVHMNAFTADGRLAVARRAEHKAIDPGLWDNLVGGMVAAGEIEVQALAREAHEEAGLELQQLPLVAGGRFREQRPVAEGYMVETVQVFDTVLPADVRPRNLDGEVAEIALRDLPAVIAAIERDEFTLEAALVTLDALLRAEWRHS